MIYHNFSHTSQDNINKNKNKLSKHPRENKQNMSDKAMKELAAKRAKSGSRRGAHVLPAIDDLALVRLEKPGDQVQALMSRNGTESTVQVTLGSRGG